MDTSIWLIDHETARCIVTFMKTIRSMMKFLIDRPLFLAEEL